VSTPARTPLVLLPDVSRLLSAYLRTVDDVIDLVGERVYTAFPKQVGNQPFVLIQRVGGLPRFAHPLILDIATIQLDAYGGTQAQAHELVATCRAAAVLLRGEQPEQTGNVCDVVAGALRYVPDETYKPPRPRYVSDLEVAVKPAGLVLAGAA
jgi:hypothetical protein